MITLIIVLFVLALMLLLPASVIYKRADNSDARAIAGIAFLPGAIVLVAAIAVLVLYGIYRLLS